MLDSKNRIVSMLMSMYKLQNDFNNETNGEVWKTGVTKEGKEIDWNLCIVQETAELIDSFPWKHWKDLNASPDLDNARMELIDIWHFVMSEHIRLTTNDILIDATHLADTANNMFTDAVVNEPCDVIFKTVKEKAFKLLNIVTSDNLIKKTDKLLYTFFSLSETFDMDIDSIYKLYLIKNVLNVFRQKNGYKDGTYHKVLDGIEDNVRVTDIANELSKNDSLSYNSLYTALDFSYKRSIKNV